MDVRILHGWRVNDNFIELSTTASDPNMKPIKNIPLSKDRPVFLFCSLIFLYNGVDVRSVPFAVLVRICSNYLCVKNPVPTAFQWKILELKKK